MDAKQLHEMQSWTLDQKIYHSLEVIGTFVERMGGIDKVYVSFSGGKDSAVMLDLCRRVYPNITCVFINTGNEYPEVVKYVREMKSENGINLTIIRPRMKPREVWESVGFPLVSKEAAQQISTIRKSPDCKTSVKWLRQDNKFKLANRWRYLIDEKYDTSHKCCVMLKKQPAHEYEKETGRSPIIGIMACESRMRETKYIQMGDCNSFGCDKRQKSFSYPLAIWTDDDIWEYIKRFKLKIADIYYKGASRTGCVGCGFGAYRDYEANPSLQLLYKLYPKYYNMIMSYTNNGVTYREAMRKLKSVTGNKLPDEI